MESSNLVKKLAEIREENFIDNSILENLCKEINELIINRLEALYKHFGDISGGTEMSIAFLRGLKALGHKTEEIDHMLYKYTDFRFSLGNGILYIDGSNKFEEYLTFEPFELDDEFVKKCIEDIEYIHKLDELFEYVEKFLDKLISRANQIKNEIEQELEKTQTFKIVALQRMVGQIE